MDALIIIITSLSLFIVIYHHVMYPSILRFVYFLRKNDVFSCVKNNSEPYDYSVADHQFPYITIVMPAYNEERFIAEKIRNLACLDYPNDRFEIILAADGCTDNTVRVAKEVHDEDVCKDIKLIIKDFPCNRGKTRVINSVLLENISDIIAFTDVSSLISVDALKVAAARFEDSTVGAVNGNYFLLNPGCLSEVIYWNYQRKIKMTEEILGSVLGAHGGFYCVRGGLVKPLPKNTINDDFIIPMLVIEQGYRVVYELDLNILEMETSDEEINWGRRVRIGMGNVQQVLWLYKLFHPKYRGIALAFFSGKGLRAFMPLFMLSSFFGCWLLSYMPLFLMLAVFQVLAYFLVIIAHISQSLKEGKFLGSLYYLVVGHAASFVGFVRYLKSDGRRYW